MAMTLSQFKALFPDDPLKTGLVDTLQEESVVLPLLHFVPVDGLTYRYSERKKLPGIGFRSINGTYTPGASVVNPGQENLVPFGGSVQTDQIFIDIRGGKARQTEIAATIRAAGLFFDKVFFKGDATADPKSFDGLQVRIPTGSSQLFYMGDNGGPLDLATLNAALDAVRGPNTGKVIHCNKTVRRKITNLVLAAAGGATVLDVHRDVEEYKGARIIPVEEDNDGSAILDFDETRGSSNVTTSLYIVRYGSATDETDVQGLVSSKLFSVREPVNMGEYVKDVIETVAGIAVFGARSIARIGGITNA